MKKILFLIVISITAFTGLSQRLRLNAYGGYMFDDGFESSYAPNTFFVGTVKGGGQWGGAFEYMMKANYCFEAQYLHQTTEVPYSYKLGENSQTKSETPTLTIDAFMFGSDGHLPGMSGMVEGYAGLFLGTAHFHASNFSSGKSWSADKFSMSARLGCNVWVYDKVGLRFQAQFLTVIRGTGTDLYTGTVANNYGLNSYSGIYQFGLGSGITMRLGK